jgi:predicted NBD/HSP70 family sugar kinase
MGNQYCIEKWKIYLDYLATGINNIHTIFDSDVIIGGEIDQYLEQSSDILYQKLAALDSFNKPSRYLYFSRYGDKASAVGAALLFVNTFLSD